MYYYALIDTTNYICYEVTESETEVTDMPHYVQIDSYDTSYIIRKKYVDGQWLDTTPSEAQNMEAKYIGIGDVWLDDKIYGMEYDIDNHTHTGYVSSDELTSLENIVNTKANITHTHSDYSLNTHSHTASEIGAAANNHNHDSRYYTETEINTLLSNKADSTHNHNSSYDTLGTAETKANAVQANLNAVNNELTEHTDNTAIHFTEAERTKLSGIASSANNYTHPNSGVTAGTYKSVTVNAQGHVTSGSNPTTLAGYGITDADAKGAASSALVSAKSYTDSKVAALVNSAPTTMDTLKEVADAIANHQDVTDALNSAIGTKANTSELTAHTSNKTNPHSVTKSQIGLGNVDNTSDVNKPISTAVQSALNGKASTSHNHNASYIAKALSMIDDDGDIKVSWSDQDVIAKIKALGSGMYTAYAKGGTTNNPKTTESWRFLVHKTGTANYGWVIAFGSSGSIYTGYVDNASWKGWKCLYNATSNDMILWSGASYLNSSNSTPQVVTPSKKLSQCRTGWLLLWSDYDPGDSANDSDFCTTFIPKYTPSGGTWGGKCFYCDIPMYVGGDVTDLSTEKRCIKPVYVHDNCLKGSYQNTSGGRNDVVLRAVYEV